ncbi:MAG: MBL fold metallo-hydrolase [Bacteroidales bacterium]|nr:MBL fold metallo-hydrolase [Bacteroidales bacterium]
MKIERYINNSFEENTYIVYDDDTRECAIIDPGCYSTAEREAITSSIAQLKLRPVMIVNTHCHVDHILGVNFLKKTYGIPFAANNADQYLLDNADLYGSMWGWKMDGKITIDIDCTEGTELKVGNSILKCAATPGHTPGGMAIYSDDGKFIFTGDTLFRGTIGRTDLPGGDYDAIIASIRNRLMRFDSQYEVFPGHGESTSIAEEAANNPMIGIED